MKERAHFADFLLEKLHSYGEALYLAKRGHGYLVPDISAAYGNGSLTAWV